MNQICMLPGALRHYNKKKSPLLLKWNIKPRSIPKGMEVKLIQGLQVKSWKLRSWYLDKCKNILKNSSHARVVPLGILSPCIGSPAFQKSLSSGQFSSLVFYIGVVIRANRFTHLLASLAPCRPCICSCYYIMSKSFVNFSFRGLFLFFLLTFPHIYSAVFLGTTIKFFIDFPFKILNNEHSGR